MVSGLEYITFEEGMKLLTEASVLGVQRSQGENGKGQSNIGSLCVGGHKSHICDYLLGGGTKEVYDVATPKGRYALALPGVNKAPNRARILWEEALMEPKNTDILRKLGLKVNDLSEIVSAEIDGVKFPAIIMGRYEDQEMSVYDSKNNHRNQNPLVSKDTKVTESDFLRMMDPLVMDVVTLVKNGIMVSADSINYCQGKDGSGRLYFNDLGNMKISREGFTDTTQAFKWHIIRAVDALMASFARIYHQNSSLKLLDESGRMDNIISILVERAKEYLAKPVTNSQ